MNCPACRSDNLDSDAFCRECGTKLTQICPNCEAGNSTQYAFCGNCGYRLISESMAIAEVIEPEHMAEAPQQISRVEAPAPAVKTEVIAHSRVATGIEGLDQLIGGGLLAGKVYLVSGESGTGKTVFGLQYLYYGLLRGENCIYISGDEKASHLVVDAGSLGWDFDKYVRERRLLLLDVAPYLADIRVGKKKEVDVRTVVNDLTKQVKSVNAKRIVIDPIAPLVFVPEHSAFVQEYVRDLILAIEDSLGCTIVITSGIITGTSKLSRYGIEEFVSEGVIVLGVEMRDGKHVRALYLRKMRSTATDIEEHVFEIVLDRGIVIKE